MSELALDVKVARRLPKPVFARTPLLDGIVPGAEAFQVILFECLAHASANVAPVVEARDCTGLHQLRVGLRRLRVALSTFGKGLPELEALNARAKTICTTLGPARDLDVFLSDLFEPAVAQLGHQSGFEILRARALRAREKAWGHAVEVAADPSFTAFQDAVAAAACAKLWDDTLELSMLAPAYLDQHLKRAKTRGRDLAGASVAERHRLRIGLKKLRYTAEFFAAVYKPKKVARFMTPLKELQDLLGALNDVALVRGILGRLMLEEVSDAPVQAELSHATGLLLGWHQSRADQMILKTTKRWKAFQKAEVFWG
ncbi:CHAD domain-containing protein [Rhizomicrobium palustre]|uniref:CHAD domain-containing protein n=1 Tax=Rhizomicrobium palustre TaxID=189966 RepID=A0A846MYK0_9PROT|nr:CHAD domain-containing protein [Rhizomicrobium palustre]NIK88112.1 CHAD domain-containing protein [Rhizomicrobium palustre]